MNLFNEHRDASLPELAEATCALLEVVWEDDYESFGLVNASDDPALFAVVTSLDAAVRADSIPVLSREEIAAVKEEGWHDAEGELALSAISKLQTADGYPSKAIAILEDAWMLIEEGNEG
jgi:hypothetical protein